MQYVIVVQNTNTHDTIIEADSNSLRDQTPRQDTKISNFTFIHNQPSADGGAAVYIRGGADYALLNGVIVSPTDACIRVRHAETVAGANASADENGPPVFRSVVMQCASPAFVGTDGPTAGDVEAIFNGGSNNNASFTPTLSSLFINGSNENGVAAFNPTALSSFFDAVSYIGAVRNSSDTWYAGWTCNSATANLSGGSACTSLPVY